MLKFCLHTPTLQSFNLGFIIFLASSTKVIIRTRAIMKWFTNYLSYHFQDGSFDNPPFRLLRRVRHRSPRWTSGRAEKVGRNSKRWRCQAFLHAIHHKGLLTRLAAIPGAQQSLWRQEGDDHVQGESQHRRCHGYLQWLTCPGCQKCSGFVCVRDRFRA